MRNDINSDTNSDTNSVLSFPVLPIVRIWLLRILVPLNGQRELVGELFFGNERLMEAVGLSAALGELGDDYDPTQAKIVLRSLYAASEAANVGDAGADRAMLPEVLTSNLSRIQAMLCLNDAECLLLAFAALSKTIGLIDQALDTLGGVSVPRVIQALAIILGLPETAVRGALGPGSALGRSGLLTLGSGGRTLCDKLDLINASFAERITSFDIEPIELISGTVKPGKPAQLARADYPHVGQQLQVLLAYLEVVRKERRKGVNILIHGAPGTGKTELARLVATELGCALYEIGSTDEDDDPIDGLARLRAFLAAQCLLAGTPSLVLFDEVDGVLEGRSRSHRLDDGVRDLQRCKAWINQALEENPIPSIWLSNFVHHIDNAVLRRFDMVFELPVPPRSQREKIISTACAGMIDATAIARLAEAEQLSPAVIARACNVAKTINADPDNVDLDNDGEVSTLEMLVSGTLVAQGHPKIRSRGASDLPDYYDPTFIQTDVDLTKIAASLMRQGSGRICLYGPPGTGKTAFGQWLAEQKCVPLHVKRASDLISKWVGGTERNIANAFSVASEDKAILLIDEVDSFLQDRHAAQHSWEITGVNEMLTQMERFDGIFIATTNLMDNLDAAALRRFDLKVCFAYLKPAQIQALFERTAHQLGLDSVGMQRQGKLANLGCLTPGDFANVLRQSRLNSVSSADELFQRLEAECMLKRDGHKRPMGFC